MLLSRVLLSCAFFYSSYESYKILGVTHFSVKSHLRLSTKLFSELAKNGYEVTVITPTKKQSSFTNLKEIHVEELEKIFLRPSFDIDDTSFRLSFLSFIEFNSHLCELILSNKKVQELLNSSETFDAVVVHQYASQALYSLAERFKAPLILFSPLVLHPGERFLLSQVVHPAYIPNMLLGYTGRMNFWQRLKNTIFDVSMIIHQAFYVFPKHRDLVYRHVPGVPDLNNFYSNVSLVLVNSHVSVNEAVPYEPHVVEIGGYHIDNPKPLPSDLKKFLDDSHNGVILFSMGSTLNCAELPEEKLNAFIKVFSKLKENILWRLDLEKPLKLPENVKIMKWLPQQDVLAHPNVKAFLTHGGLLGVLETVHFGKPFIAIPIFADQKLNTAQGVAREYGIHVPYTEVTEEKLMWAFNEVLNNSKYKDNAIKYSEITKNRHRRPAETLVYWVEYVIHHRGNPHLIYSKTDERNNSNILTLIVTNVIVFIFLVTCSIALFYKLK